MENYTVSALYHFVKLEDFEDLKAPLLDFMVENEVKGTLLLAHEGINGTVAGSAEAIEKLHSFLRKDARLENLTTKESWSDKMPFNRSKVKLKKEIVTMGVTDVDPLCIVGTYVKPQDWNALISDPETILIDTRNEYEIAIGTFKYAVNPNIDTFREFPQFAEDYFGEQRKKKVAMFCTGGIRCEKSTSYFKQLGFDEVYHLQGGILKYLEEIPEEDSLWEGECFVFDRRVAVKHGLELGQYDQCYACRMPITEKDKLNAFYVKGISCHHCHDTQTERQKSRHEERERQVARALAKGEEHMGCESVSAQASHSRHV